MPPVIMQAKAKQENFCMPPLTKFISTFIYKYFGIEMSARLDHHSIRARTRLKSASNISILYEIYFAVRSDVRRWTYIRKPQKTQRAVC